MDVTGWLLDSDPALRWQVLRDLTEAPSEEVEAERARIANEGWGARLLGMADQNGLWAGGAFVPREVYDAWKAGVEPPVVEGQHWTSTSWALQQLRDFGIDPNDQRVQDAIELVRRNGRWEHDEQPFFDGEVEPCINGRTVAAGAYFSVDGSPDVSGIVDLLLTEQMEDGGWNCAQDWDGSTRGSFETTIDVVEGLLQYHRSVGDRPAIPAALERAHDFMLDRHLLRRLSTGELINQDWMKLSYPPRSKYDVLRALDYLRSAGVEPDERWNEAVGIVRSKRQPDGRWLLENTHPGPVSFELEDGDGKPSRWNTLRALRVLEWVDSHSG